MNRYTAHDISKKKIKHSIKSDGQTVISFILSITNHLKLSDNIFYYVITLTLCIFSHVLLYFHKQSKLLNEVDNHRTPLD